MTNKKKSKAGFISAIVVLLISMTIGFLLLSSVYTGPAWVEFIVFVVYLIVVLFVIKYSHVFVSSFYKDEKKDEK